MRDKTIEEKCSYIASQFGEKQIPLMIEEMAELTQALTKYMRIMQYGQPVRKGLDEVTTNIKEEFADVYVMMLQLQEILCFNSEQIKYIAHKKLCRTIELLEVNDEL